MFGRQRGGWGRARPGLTLVELLTAIAVLGVLGCLVLSRQEASPALETSTAVPEPPVLTCPAPEPELDELSLQETLDRLGYTVNVPPSFRGHSLDPRGYRQSTLDDSREVAWFKSTGTVSMQLISQQTDLDAATRFVVEQPFGEEETSFEPVMPCGFDDSPRLMTWASGFPVRFRLDFPPNGDRSESVYSTPGENGSDAAQLMVLPARKHGVWVQQGEGSGYWVGGEESGDLLLCWEDRSGSGVSDFQDLVFVTRGMKPSIGPVVDVVVERHRPAGP